MTNKYNAKNKVKYLNEEIKNRLTNLPDNYLIEIDFDNYYERFDVELFYYAKEIIKGSDSNWGWDKVFEIRYDTHISDTKLLNDIVLKVNEYIKENYIGYEIKNNIINKLKKIMDEYSEEIEIRNEYDESCSLDYSIYVNENNLQCGGDTNDECGLCFNVYENVVEDLNDEKGEGEYKQYKYSNEEDLRFAIFKIMKKYIDELKEDIESKIEEREDNYDDFEDYTPPEEYPDWDGEESIMYEIEHYVEDEEEIYCPNCGSDDLENYGGSFECNDCGYRDNI